MNIENLDDSFVNKLNDVNGCSITSESIVIDSDFYNILSDDFEILLSEQYDPHYLKIIFVNSKIKMINSWSLLKFNKFIRFMNASSKVIIVNVSLYFGKINGWIDVSEFDSSDRYDINMNKIERKVISFEQMKGIRLIFDNNIYNTVANSFGVKRQRIYNDGNKNYFFYRDSACYRDKLKIFKRLDMIIRNAHNRNLKYPLLEDYFVKSHVPHYISLKNNFII